MKKFAHIAIVGLPNVGKSTIFNAIVNQYIAPVTYKPQTTINHMLYIVNHEDTQLAIYDLPGYIVSHEVNMKKSINKMIKSIILHSEIILIVINASTKINQYELDLIESVEQFIDYQSQKIIFILNKIDLVQDNKKLLSYQDKYPNTIATSAKYHNSLKAYISQFANKGDWKYESQNNFNLRNWSCEITRQCLLERFHKEIPYQLDITIALFKTEENQILIHQNIVIPRPSYKPILLGQKGLILKSISKKSRAIISNYTNKTIHLFLHVKALHR